MNQDIQIRINRPAIVMDALDPTGGNPMGKHTPGSLWSRVDQIFPIIFPEGTTLGFTEFQTKLRAMFTCVGFNELNAYNWSRKGFMHKKYEWAGWITIVE